MVLLPDSARILIKRTSTLLPRGPGPGPGPGAPILHTGVIVVLIILIIMIVLTLLCCIIGRIAAMRQNRNEDQDLEAGEDGDALFLDVDIDGLPARPPPAYSRVDERADDGDACSVDTLPRYDAVAPVGVVVVLSR